MSNYLSNEELDSELVIGLVCAVGTESRLVIDLLKERLGLAGYRVEVAKISRDVIPRLVEVPFDAKESFERYSALMTAGNQCRAISGIEALGDDSILALGASAHIAALRKNISDESDEDDGETSPPSKVAYIIDSLKRPEEVEKLRVIYPSGFVLLGIHADFQIRRNHLIQDKGMSMEQADSLLARDSEEAKEPHGQRVNSTFHLADFFVQIQGSREALRNDIKRLVELWFGNPFLTPTFDEYAMFFAFAAALRSADLSRQVGAVVTRRNEIVATGANDCPAAGGGLYWAIRNEQTGKVEDASAGRDYMRPDGDSLIEQSNCESLNRSFKRQKRLVIDLMKFIAQVLKQSGIKDLTEFGRVVHAEMEALLSYDRKNGISTTGAAFTAPHFLVITAQSISSQPGFLASSMLNPTRKVRPFHFMMTRFSLPERIIRWRSVEPFAGVGPRRLFELFSVNLGSVISYRESRQTPGKSRTGVSKRPSFGYK
ncbi:MAG: cytidine deaminase [Pirellulales bacterium]